MDSGQGLKAGSAPAIAALTSKLLHRSVYHLGSAQYDALVGQKLPLPSLRDGYASWAGFTPEQAFGSEPTRVQRWLAEMSDATMVGIGVGVPALLVGGGWALGGLPALSLGSLTWKGAAVYAGTQALMALGETGLEYGVSQWTGNDFNPLVSFGKNFGINLITGGIGGGARGVGKVGAWFLQQGVETLGDTAYDVLMGGDLFQSLATNAIANVAGDLAFRGLGAALRRGAAPGASGFGLFERGLGGSPRALPSSER